MKNFFKISIVFVFLMMLLFFIFFIDEGIVKEDVSYAASSSSASDLQLMARAINGEARGEPYEGQVAVGAVILNRVQSY